jgi:hypothetical protein
MWDFYKRRIYMRGTALKVGLLVAVGSLGLASSPALADVCLTVEGVTQNLTTGTQGRIAARPAKKGVPGCADE